MGWEVCPTLLHLSISAPLPALPPSVNHGWLLPCHLQSNSIDFYIATISQTRLTFPCHQQSGTADFSLSPAVRHGWLFLVTSSQARLTFPCHQQSDTADFSLPPVSRTPCSVATNVLDIQSVYLRAIYSVHFRWMNIAVCKQMSGWLIFYPVHLWKPTHSWTLYHLCDSISIYIKQISLSQHMWYDTFWCGKNYYNVLLVSSKIELAFSPCLFMFCHEKNMFRSKQRLDSNIVWNYTDDGDHIQFGIFLKKNKFQDYFLQLLTCFYR